jgi:hypothetical protein
MMKIGSAFAALIISAAVVTLAVTAALWLLPFFADSAHHWWFLPACNLVTLGCLITAGFKMRRAKPAEREEPRTPLVRRSPVTGLREF